MRFEYLWDEPANTLLLRFPTSGAQAMVGLLVSADGAQGEHWPLLGVAMTPGRREDPQMVELYVPLGDIDQPAGLPVYLTVEPICGDARFGALAADRVALVRGVPPAGAALSYWMVDTQDEWALIDVLDMPPDVGAGVAVLCSARSADTIYPAVPVAVPFGRAPLHLRVTRESYAGGIAHVMWLQAPGGRDGVLRLHVLPGFPDVCNILLPAGAGAQLAPPLKTLQLARMLREGVEVRVHAGAMDPDLVGHGLPDSTQFLDRVVVSVDPHVPIHLTLDDKAVGLVTNPLVLVDLGDGRLAVDPGLLQARLAAELFPTPLPDATLASAALTGAPFVEVVRRGLVNRITRALPAVASLRPAHTDALRASASLYQTLGWFDLSWLSVQQQAAMRQAHSPLRGEADSLRQLCRIVVKHSQRAYLSGEQNDLDRARIEAWLTRSSASAREAAHHCVAVLGWDETAELLLLGCRPDPLQLVRPDETELETWRATAMVQFSTLHGLGLLQGSVDDLLVDSAGMAEAARRIEADWRDAQDTLDSAQDDLGFHPALGLAALVAPPEGPRPHRLLVQTLQARLLAGLVATLEPRAAGQMAEAMAARMAGALNDDFRKLLALVQRENLTLPSFFATGPGVAEGAAAFAAGASMPTQLGDAESLAEWLGPRIEDMPLVRVWKVELRGQMPHRPPLHAADGRRPL